MVAPERGPRAGIPRGCLCERSERNPGITFP